MKSIWVHGTYFVEFEGNYYHHNLTQKIWEDRYLKFFDNIIVCSRVKKAKSKEEIAGKQLSIARDDSRMSFCELKIGFFTKKNQATKIRELLNDVDVSIIRVPAGNSHKVAKFAEKMNKPYMVEVVGCVWDALTTHSFKGKLVAPLFFCNMKRAVKNATFGLYVTKDFLQKRYKCKGLSFSCSDVKLSEIDSEVVHNRLNFCRNFSYKQTVNITTIGAVDVKYKGQEFVIRAMSKLKKQGYNFKYILVGGGDTSRLQNIANMLGVGEDVVFTGNLTHDKVYEVLDNTHIYVHPSLTEGLPRSVLEAKSRGCAVVCSKVGGIPEIVDKENLFNKKDIKAIMDFLVGYNPRKLENEAVANIAFAKQFALCNSNEIRDEFMKTIINTLKNQKG